MFNPLPFQWTQLEIMYFWFCQWCFRSHCECICLQVSPLEEHFVSELIHLNMMHPQPPSPCSPDAHVTCCWQSGWQAGQGATMGSWKLSTLPCTAQLTFLRTTQAHQFLRRETRNKQEASREPTNNCEMCFRGKVRTDRGISEGSSDLDNKNITIRTLCLTKLPRKFASFQQNLLYFFYRLTISVYQEIVTNALMVSCEMRDWSNQWAFRRLSGSCHLWQQTRAKFSPRLIKAQ